MNARSVGPPGLRPFLSLHALQRCQEMGVSRGEVVDALADHEIRYPSGPEYGPGRYVSVRGRLAVVHSPTWEVVTVLWNGRDAREAA
jgi:hypothetical protein